MSTLKVDALSSKTTDTDLAITADGSGLVDIETGFKVSGTAGVPTADIRADAITGAKIADDAIDSEHYVDGSIDSAHLADDAVTLAKMASGTDGNIISYDASGNPVAVATGTDGQVLTSSGAGAVCAFEDAAGGGKILQITSTNFTNTPAIDSATYVSTAMTGTITPTASDSTLLIFVTVGGVVQTAGVAECSPRISLYRDINGGGYSIETESDRQCSSIRLNTNASLEASFTGSMIHADSPATTDVVSYRIYMLNNGADGAVGLNYNNNESHMTIMEISA